MSITIENQTSLELPLKIIEEIVASLTDREVDLLVCDNDTMQKLNAKHRGVNHPTDVLSFPLESELPMMPLGSMAISSDYVQAKARELGHTAQEESILLIVHGLLHILSYDHEVDDGEMRAKEEEIIAHYDLPPSLIVRTRQSQPNEINNRGKK